MNGTICAFYWAFVCGRSLDIGRTASLVVYKTVVEWDALLLAYMREAVLGLGKTGGGRLDGHAGAVVVLVVHSLPLIASWHVLGPWPWYNGLRLHFISSDIYPHEADF